MKKSHPLRDYFRGRFILQFVSVLSAFALWIFVNSGQRVDEKRPVKIQYTRMPSNLTFERTPLKEVAIGLSGPFYRLRGLKDDDLTYLVDLSNARAGSNRVELTLDALKLPLDLEATFPNPRVFFVYLEELAVKELPLRPTFVGQLEGGLSVGKISLKPEIVTVTGPRSILSKLDSVPFEIALDGRTSSFSWNGKPKLSVPATEVRENVYAEIEISTVKLTKEFVNVPVIAKGRSEVSIEPALATVIIEGPEREIQGSSWQPQVVVETKDLKKGRFLLRGKVEVSSSLKVIEIKPQNFLVEVLQ